MRYFNTEGLCNPDKHYMVDITERLIELKKMIDAGKYFVINRGRQYGKTTTINELCGYIKDEYYVLSLDFRLWIMIRLKMGEFLHRHCLK